MFNELFSKLEIKYGDDFSWWRVPSVNEVEILKELDIELNKNHNLYKKVKSALAKCDAKDDVLFLLNDDSYAIIHLTWSGKKESTGVFPYFKEFSNLQNALIYIENEYISEYL